MYARVHAIIVVCFPQIHRLIPREFIQRVGVCMHSCILADAVAHEHPHGGTEYTSVEMRLSSCFAFVFLRDCSDFLLHNIPKKPRPIEQEA